MSKIEAIELTYLISGKELIYYKNMIPRIAICNIFGQDADRLLDFACLNGFEGVDWSIDQNQSEKEFILKKGDSAYYNAVIPHQAISLSKKPARVLNVHFIPSNRSSTFEMSNALDQDR